ncbi:MAG: chloride channel protein [Bacteroidota bacterium]
MKPFLINIVSWRNQFASKPTFLIIASIIVGVVSALVAVLLKTIVHVLHQVPEFYNQYLYQNLWLFVFPIVGVLLTILIVKLVLKGKIEKGLGNVLYAITRKSSKIPRVNTYSQIITSSITVGLGGSAGLEAPIAITGSAIGSNLGSFFKLGRKERTLLLACGAASGIAAVFNSPITGVIFAIEVLLVDFSIPSFIPLLISTASATIVSKLLFKGQLFYLVSHDWVYSAIPFYIVLGILCGFLSVYMKRITLWSEGYFNTKRKVVLKTTLGLVLLGFLIFLLPPLFGEGYTSIESLLNGHFSDILNYSIFESFKDNAWFILLFTAAIILMKIMATALTVGTGGNGGIFAPSLFTGAFTGFGLAHLVNTTQISNLNTSNFIVAGMAGILSGVVHAPLTAIFLIAEITGGYTLFVPLMLVSALSYFITRIFEPHSVYTKKLAEAGNLLTDDKDSNVLKYLKLEDMIEKDFAVLHTNDYLQNLIEAFSNSKRSIFPVVTDTGELAGVIFLDKVKNLMFKTELYETMKITDITETSITISTSDSMESAMETFEQSNLWNIPVLEQGKYIGFISRSTILNYYRKIVKKNVSLF